MLIPFGVFSAGVSSGNGGAGSFDLISTTILGSSAASVTFDVTGLGSTYKHLQIRSAHKSDVSDNLWLLRFNSDSGSNYSWHQLGGDGATVFSSGGTSSTSIFSGQNPSTTTSRFAGTVLDMLDLFSSSKNKTTRTFTGNADLNKVILRSGAWYSTSVVTSVSITSSSGNFVSGSRFSIYGVK